MLKKLLIVLDSLGFNNGAHVATRAMIAALRERGVCVDLLLGGGEKKVGQESRSTADGEKVFVLPEPVRGLRWFVQGVYRRLKIAPVPRWVIDPWGRMRRVMRGYDTILVIGENAHYRHLVAGVSGASFLSTLLHLYTAKKKSPRKVVFIHTDYVSWKSSCDWAIEDARFDRQIYRGFDVIGVVGEANAERFREYYPEFREKTRAFHNLFLGGGEKVGGESRWTADGACLIGRGEDAASTRLVTISRLELGPPKMMERLVRVAGALKRRGCRFDWKVYGKGHAADEARLKELAREEKVDDRLHFVGFTSNVRGALAGADLHVLLSAYEGAPNVIVEAQLAGVPCIATDVGAVREMIAEGTGLVLPQDEKMIVEKMAEAIGQRSEVGGQRSEVERWKVGLKGYRYDNERVMREYGELLGVDV